MTGPLSIAAERPYLGPRWSACGTIAAAMNRLFYGDNLEWLRDPDFFPSASVDLIYLDPPFN